MFNIILIYLSLVILFINQKKLKAIKKTYFISDIHLGANGRESSIIREQRLISWLDKIKSQADTIYFLGDIFDFWYEWKRVIPSGFARFFGKICELTDNGVNIHFFTGNHDVWMFNYFEKELGVIVHRETLEITIAKSNFFLAHGDALGPGDNLFKIVKKIFKNKVAQWLFSRFHPNFAIALASRWSKSNRKQKYFGTKYTNAEAEWLVLFSHEVLKSKHIDYFIFGHRHIPMIHKLSENSTYINTGDWLGSYSYTVFDGTNIELRYIDLDNSDKLS